MDGNHSWSKRNSINKYNGYKRGAQTLISLTKYIFKHTNTQYVSAFALSKNNLNRSKNLISTLKKVLLHFLNNEIKEKKNSNFNIRFIGDKSFLNSEIKNKINIIENLKTKSKKFLIIYINYSGKDDIKQAAYNYHINLSKKNSHVDFEDLLLTKNIPDPDILIRTGGYSRLSNFLIYQCTFTELFFTKKLWPDLKNNDLNNFFNKYYLLERKFGL